MILLEWPAGDLYYPWSATETRSVGRLTALIMDKVVDDGGASYDDIWCIGHSLGSHVCGFAGGYATGEIDRITGECSFQYQEL